MTPSNAIFSRLAVALAAVLGLFMTAMAPEPEPVPRRWQFDLKTGPLRVATVEVPEVGRRSYFYMTYKVTNNTGQDLLLAPAFDLAADSGEVIRSGRDVPADVTRQVLSELQSPFIQDQIGVLGILLQGEENAREGVVIWPANSLDSGEIVVYAGGFSGETRAIEVADPKTGKPTKATLRKTLMQRYLLPGELRKRDSTPLEPYEVRWVLR